MAGEVRLIEYYYANVDDMSGVAFHLLEIMQRKKVNLTAVLTFPVSNGRAQIDFFPESPDALRAAMAEVGIGLTGPRHAFIIQGADHAGAMTEHYKDLAEAKINVVAAFGVTDGRGRFGYIVFVDKRQFKTAAEVLGCEVAV